MDVRQANMNLESLKRKSFLTVPNQDFTVVRCKNELLSIMIFYIK
jgi:hypothetical protein